MQKDGKVPGPGGNMLNPMDGQSSGEQNPST